MKLFSPEHWDAILSAVEDRPPRRNRKAERLWIKGRQAHLDYQPDKARRLFEQAALEDPGMTDAYLGLYWIADTNEKNEDVCKALAFTADRLDQTTERTGQTMLTYYIPFCVEPVPIWTPNDARLTLVLYLVLDGQFDAARAWLTRCDSTASRTALLQGHLALMADEFADAARCFQHVAAVDVELRGDALLGLGVALTWMERHDEAVAVLEEALRTVPDKPFYRAEQLFVRYRLALAYGCACCSPEAKTLLESIYADAPDYLDVADRLRAGHVTPRA
jgi:hypothetical protein